MYAEALRLLRTRKGLTQTAASKREGAPDFRTLSHWETRRKLLHNYLTSLGLDLCDLQEALHQVEGTVPKHLRDGLERLRHRVEKLERRLGLPSPGSTRSGATPDLTAGEAHADD